MDNIEKNLRENKYQASLDFKIDMKSMFQTALLKTQADTALNQKCLDLQQQFDQFYDELAVQDPDDCDGLKNTGKQSHTQDPNYQ